MEFRILGPLEVAHDGRSLPPAAHKPWALLALLLLHRGEAVSLERLADELWGEQPPATAAKSVQVYVSQLRKVLGEGVLETRGRAYGLMVEPDQIDAARFERMLDEGVDNLAQGRPREAAAVLSQGLALWRGPPLADFTYEPWAQREIGRLEALRLAAIEERIEADLALGRQAALIPELEALVELHPSRERLCGQLMLALYRSGRQTEALEAFRERRRRIVDELGIEPGPALRELESAILRQDPELEAPARPRGPAALRRGRSGRLIALGGTALLMAALAAAIVAIGREADTPVGRSLRPLPESFCSPLAYAPGAQPRHMIVSDQDLTGPERVLGNQITSAVEFVLRERGFRAGSRPLAYQACDSQSDHADGSGDCRAHARVYAENPAVLGVVGPLGSGCAEQVIPVANAAGPGPLAMVSPSNTRVALTRRGSQTPPYEPERYYPTGVRNYVRLIAADDFQVAAQAMLAQRLGIRRVFVIFHNEDGAADAETFSGAAQKLALEVVGSNRRARPGDYESVASEVKRSHADGVVLAGGLEDGAEVVKALRAALGRRVPILANDGFSSPERLTETGAAAEGMLVSVPGADPQAVTGPGRALIDRLSAAVGDPHPYTVSAVQATELLLDAIGRSNGTRRSVVSELFASEVRGGVLGDFSVTPAGDTTANRVTIYRIEHGKLRIDRVLDPPLSLVVSN